MDFRQEAPVGLAAQSVAKAANISGLLQAMAVGALPAETVEGLLMAAEITIVVQLAIGTLEAREAETLRAKIADWGRGLAERMEADGTADQIRKQHAENLEEYRKAREGGDDGTGPN